jgi:hypothetical protein
MDPIAAPGEAWAYANREGLIEKDGITAIFVDSRCRPLGTSKVWPTAERVADSIEQVREGLRLGAAGLLLVCDSAKTAASAAGHVASLRRLAHDYGLLLLDVIAAAGDAAPSGELEPNLVNGRAQRKTDPVRRFASR